MRVEDELAGDPGIEVRVTLRCVLQADDGRVDRVTDVHLVRQDRVHQSTVVLHHRALTGGERMRLRPAEAEPDRQRADLGRLVAGTGVAGDVQPGDAESTAGGGELHQRVEHGGRGLLAGVLAVPVGLETDCVDATVDLGHAQDLFDLLPGIALGDVDRLAADLAGLSQPFLVQVTDDDDGGTEQLGGDSGRDARPVRRRPRRRLIRSWCPRCTHRGSRSGRCRTASSGR